MIKANLLRLAFLFLVTVFAGGAVPAYAENTTHYVSTEELPPQALPPPPAEGSAGWQKNIDGVLRSQLIMNSEDLQEMKDEQQIRIGIMTDHVGKDFTAKKYPHTFRLLQNVYEDCGRIINADKYFWQTRRPYLTQRQVRLLIDPLGNNPSYPSGHAAASQVLAEVLSMLYPNRAEEFHARADKIAEHRVEAGVHYPVDIEGGKILAAKFVDKLKTSSAFKADLAAAKREVRH